MRTVVGTVVLVLAAPVTALAQRALPDPYAYPEPAWSPYLVGAGIGALLLATLAMAGRKIGASSAYLATVGLTIRALAPRRLRDLPHFRGEAPRLGWTPIFVLGAVGGAFLSAWTGGELNGTYLQDLWVARFGADSHLLRTLIAFAGGAIMALGARIAGGCTSGHGISGTAQMSVGSWIAVLAFFAGGIAVALPLYRG